ncbi:MAG: hypothetical protein H6502_02475 [Candidatus Woesearchaeota archaeon]|nr:MAG: hypothetical protein H6502_02475 [Candidatus Woesearchaeota archaeon]
MGEVFKQGVNSAIIAAQLAWRKKQLLVIPGVVFLIGFYLAVFFKGNRYLETCSVILEALAFLIVIFIAKEGGTKSYPLRTELFFLVRSASLFFAHLVLSVIILGFVAYGIYLNAPNIAFLLIFGIIWILIIILWAGFSLLIIPEQGMKTRKNLLREYWQNSTKTSGAEWIRNSIGVLSIMLVSIPYYVIITKVFSLEVQSTSVLIIGSGIAVILEIIPLVMMFFLPSKATKLR